MNVSIEILEFPLCVKNKILRIKAITKLLNLEKVLNRKWISTLVDRILSNKWRYEKIYKFFKWIL